MLAMVFDAGVFTVWQKDTVWAMIGKGTGLTRDGGGSCFL
jgi:hypothetical protein